MVVLLVATPSLMLPNSHADGTLTVAVVAVFAALFTFVEYSSSYPSLVEFRDAPPFNRLRFISLFFTVFMLTVIARGEFEPNTFTQLCSAIGTLIGKSIDFPYSPVRLVVLMMPQDTSAELLIKVRTAAGISYLTSLLSLAAFLITLRLNKWPASNGSFNVWVNLPTFDPTAGGDVVARLRRDAHLNIILGFLLPFIIPAVVKLAADTFNPVSMNSPETLIWTMTAWAFLPASLFMRGIAMGRVADMIENQRKRAYEKAQLDGFQPV
ncbi:hypothetical protein [Algirhabdus cladophorae]|uniref:hypothetical protein n=1 Tax=Algirhabdus cladophorae TaxID=3377108 RepID=UPI003B8459DC